MSGEKTAVQLAVEARPFTDEEPEQLDLLGLPVNAEVVALREKSGKSGRPPGARNKRTQEFVDFLLSRYPHPLEVLAQIYSARVDVLAAALECTKQEALQEIRLAGIAMLPYVAQKQPLAVDVTQNTRVMLTIVEEASADTGEDVTLTARVIEVEKHGNDQS